MGKEILAPRAREMISNLYNNTVLESTGKNLAHRKYSQKKLK